MIKIKWRWLRRTLRVLAVSIFLISIFVFFFLERIIVSSIESKLENSYGKTYAIEYESLDYSFSFSTLSINLKGVKFTTDPVLAMENNNPILFIESESILLESVSLWNIFFYSAMDVDLIKIDSPHISIAVDKRKEELDGKKLAETKRDVSKYISKLSFNEFTITNGTAEFFNDVGMSDTLFSLKNIVFKAENFKSENENLSELLGINKYKSISIESETFYINFGKDNYSATTGSFKVELIKGDMELYDIHLSPPFDKISAGKEFRSDIKINELKLKGIKFPENDHQTVSIDMLTIANTDIDLTKNHQLSKKREKFLWMEHLTEVNEAITIKCVTLLDCSLSARLLYLNDSDVYTLHLEKLNGTIENLNTRGNSGSLNLKATSRIFGTGKLEINVEFPYDNPLSSAFYGTISSIDLMAFNELIGTTYPLKIESGKLSKLAFKGNSKDDNSYGALTFEYTDLKGSFLKGKDKKKKRAPALSALVNMFVHSSNPRSEGKSIEEVSFFFSKKDHQGQIMLWLGGILDGVVKTIVKESNHDFVINQYK